MALIDDWKRSWKLHSVQVSTLGATAMGVWIALDDEQKRTILHMVGLDGPAIAVAVTFVFNILVRLIKQDKPEGDDGKV